MLASNVRSQRNPTAGRRQGAASRRAVVARAARELQELGRILDATHKPAEAVAARRVAADLRAAL